MKQRVTAALRIAENIPRIISRRMISAAYFLLAIIAYVKNDKFEQAKMCWKVLEKEPSLATETSRLVINGIDNVSATGPRLRTIVASKFQNPINNSMEKIIKDNKGSLNTVCQQLMDRIQAQLGTLTSEKHFKSYLLKEKLAVLRLKYAQERPEEAICSLRLMVEMSVHIKFASGGRSRVLTDTLRRIVSRMRTV